jgi:hypothetical protein
VFYRERVREQPIVRWKAVPESQKQEGASPEAREAPESDGAAGGVEGGVPGGVLGGVADSLAQPVPPATAPKSAPNESRARKDADEYAATGIGQATDHPVQWVAFEAESSPASRIAIRYEFRTELVRLGVLPREDGLFARDHARGFEPQYAPDPYRR